jgi:uncharacterized membrane protein
MAWLPDPLHPALVHFPIALSLVAVLLELVARHRRARSLEGAAAVVISLAALGSVAAVVSGNAAHDEAVVAPAAASMVTRHEEVGEIAMWLLLALAAARLVLTRSGWFTGAVPWVYLAGAVLVAGMVSYNGYLGGRMVFEHGLGTAPVQRGSAPARSGAEPGTETGPAAGAHVGSPGCSG